MIFAVDC